MPVDMERSRDGYRGRYRDRHSSGPMNRNQLDERSTRGNYHRSHPPHDDDRNGNTYPPRNSPNGNYHYRSSRPSLNSRPVSSRNGPSTSYRHYPNDDYAPTSSSNRSTSSNNNSNNTPSTYYDNHSPSSRFDRSSNHREIYSSEQSMLSNSPPHSIPLYYSSSPQTMPSSRDRSLPLPPASYVDAERHRYVLPPSSSTYRRENSPPSVMSTYRNERSMDYAPRHTNNDVHTRRPYRTPTPPSLAPLAIRADPYGDMYRSNDYAPRSERYDIPPDRMDISSRDYPTASYQNDGYRKSSTGSMSSSYSSHDPHPYGNDLNYRPIVPARDYGVSSRSAYSSAMDHPKDLSRNSRDHHNPNDYRSSHHDRPNLKRSGSRYDDNGGPIPSKRPMRR